MDNSDNCIIEKNKFTLKEVQELNDRQRPVHYRFRFTFTEQDKDHNYTNEEKKRWRSMTRGLVRELCELYTIQHLTGGIEYLNKRGEHTWAHMHIHFDSIETRDAIYRKIRRYLKEEYQQEVVGVKAFSFKPTVVRDLQDFYRYPLKQNLDIKLCRNFTEPELLHMHEVAKDSYFKVVQINQAKMDKMDTADTLFERLKVILDKSGHTTKKPLLIRSLQFYVDEKKPINRPTIQGYVDNYMLLTKLISYEEYVALYF